MNICQSIDSFTICIIFYQYQMFFKKNNTDLLCRQIEPQLLFLISFTCTWPKIMGVSSKPLFT